MPRKISLIAIPLILISTVFLGAQQDEPEKGPFTPQLATNRRSLGDQTFSISLGPIIPLKTILLGDYYGHSSGPTDNKLTWAGGTGGLAYSFYLSPDIKLGLQVGGSFTSDINEDMLFMIPIAVKGTYEFHIKNRITVPIHLGLGIAMTSWKEDNFHVDPLIRPGVGFYFDWNYEWSFGTDVSYHFIPQLDSDPEHHNAIGNFLDVMITAEYHF